MLNIIKYILYIININKKIQLLNIILRIYYFGKSYNYWNYEKTNINFINLFFNNLFILFLIIYLIIIECII